MTTTTAEELASAAKTLNQRADALNGRRWEADHHPEGTVVRPADSVHSLFQLRADGLHAAGTPCVSPAVGTWMATMHPALGLAIARWLGSFEGVEINEHGPLAEEVEHALVVARLINATS